MSKQLFEDSVVSIIIERGTMLNLLSKITKNILMSII